MNTIESAREHHDDIEACRQARDEALVTAIHLERRSVREVHEGMRRPDGTYRLSYQSIRQIYARQRAAEPDLRELSRGPVVGG